MREEVVAALCFGQVRIVALRGVMVRFGYAE